MNLTRRTRYHQVTIEDVGQLRIMRFEHNRQSSMYLDAPFDTDFEYPSYLHLPLAVAPEATRALVIGLGGGTLVKRMWRDYPGMMLDVVELDPGIVELAHEYFALPRDPRIRIHVGDGRAFLEDSAEAWDIVVLDAFDDGVVPRPLMTQEFLTTVRGHLREGGVLGYNMIGSVTGVMSRPFRSLYRTMRNVWRHVWVFVIDEGVGAEGDNIILLATDAAVATDELHRRIEDRVGGLVTVPAFETFGCDLYTRPIRGGDVPLILDEHPRRRR